MEHFEGHLLALSIVDDVLLKQFAIHAEELEQEVLVKGERYLALAHLVYHHKRDAIFLRLVAVVNHIHVDDVVLHHDIVSLSIIRREVTAVISYPYARLVIALD